jgi:hypothetical protein
MPQGPNNNSRVTNAYFLDQLGAQQKRSVPHLNVRRALGPDYDAHTRICDLPAI